MIAAALLALQAIAPAAPASAAQIAVVTATADGAAATAAGATQTARDAATTAASAAQAARDAAAAAATANQAAKDAATAAASAKASADAACRATPSIQPTETPGGTMGSAGTSCRPSDAAAVRISRATTVKTDSAGSWSVTWAMPLPGAAGVTLPIPINATAEPVVCNVATSTATGAAGRCWYARTLPATIVSLTALINYDLFGASAANISVQLIAIPPTQ